MVSLLPIAGYATALTPEQYRRLLLWTGIMSVGMLALVLIACAIARYCKRRDNTPLGSAGPGAGGFDLGELRRLHREGLLTDEEFARAKARVIAGVRSAMPPEEPPTEESLDSSDSPPSTQAPPPGSVPPESEPSDSEPPDSQGPNR